MDNIDDVSRQERNLITAARHRREVFWQITFPCVMLVLVLVTMGVLAVVPGGTTRVWADISLIWLIILASILTVILMVLLIALAYLVVKMVHGLPRYALLAQRFFARLSEQVEGAGDRAVEPVLRAHSLSASLRKLVHYHRQKR
jgi:hypothetical protein